MARKRRQPQDHVVCKHCQKDFRAITFRHLRNIHGYEGEHPIEDYKRRFHLQTAICLDSRKKISTAKEDFWAKRGRHWTRESLLAEIRRAHRDGQSLRESQVPVRVYMAGRRFFGTWEAAVAKAGLNYEEATGIRRWTPEKVVEAIRELAKRGVPLSANYARTHCPVLFNAAVKQFPHSWAKALRAAGLDPEEHKVSRRKWDGEKAENWLRERLATGMSILTQYVPSSLLHFIYGRLRTTWPDFVEGLGVPYPGLKKRRDWTKERLLAEIRRWKAEGHRLNCGAVKREYQALIHQARKFFGSWDRARAAAGV